MGDSATSQDDDAITGAGEHAQPGPAPEQSPLPGQTFELRPPPPVRALAISSAAAIAGAVVIVLSGHLATTVVGAVVLALAVALAATALILTARLRSTVVLAADGLEVTRGRHRGRLAWGDVERVEQHSHRLVAIAREGERDLVITVPGRRGTTYVRLVESLKLRLDANRGYGNAIG